MVLLAASSSSSKNTNVEIAPNSRMKSREE
jgi:hypothetical protein